MWSSIGHDGEHDCICTEYQHGRIIVKSECTVIGHSDSVYSVCFSPDGTRVVSGSRDHLVKIWDAETGAEVSSSVGVR